MFIKRAFLTVTAISFCYFAPASFAGDSKGGQLKDKKDKVSYSIGVDIGKTIFRQSIDVNAESFYQGLKDGLANKSTQMTDDEVKQTLLALQAEMVEKQKQIHKELAAKNLAAGEKFLAENKKRKDVVTLPDGLQYKILKEGTGDSPKSTDMVVTHYRGKLIDGTEFDSSYNRGEPVKFMVSNVIPGWTEALQLMKPGAEWELYIPPTLAYGENGVGQIIGPNSTLVFNVQLLKVEKPEAANSTPASTSASK